jgi:hypothetical protein
MQTLRIEAASTASAHAMTDALAEFQAELVETEDGRSEVVVTLRGGDQDIVKVLNALERYVTERAKGPARIELEGRKYSMHPEPGPSSEPEPAPAQE